MRFALMSEPQQGLSYADLVALVQRAEAEGFEAFLRSDHYGSFPGARDHPTTDAWATLAGLARETGRIRLGSLVSPVTFRHPGSFAKVVTTVDQMSGGRVEVGVGGAWNEEEHAQLGLTFPAQAERFDMLEEELQILHGLWREPDGWSFAGRYWQVRGTMFRARPVQRPHPPIILGAKGKERSIRLAARWADEYNIHGFGPSEVATIGEAFRRACQEEGRPEGSVVYSAMLGIVVGQTESEFRARVGRLMEVFGLAADEADGWIARRRATYLMGTPEQVLERVREFERAGLQRIMLQDWLPTDLEMITLIARDVMANV